MTGRAQDFLRTRDAALLHAITDALGRPLGSAELEQVTRYVEQDREPCGSLPCHHINVEAAAPSALAAPG